MEGGTPPAAQAQQAEEPAGYTSFNLDHQLSAPWPTPPASTSHGKDSGFGSARSGGTARTAASSPPAWEIKTDSETYVEQLGASVPGLRADPASIAHADEVASCPRLCSPFPATAERKLAKAKQGGKGISAQTGSNARARLSTRSEEEDETAGPEDVHEDDLPDDDEQTCLLYDAAQQQRRMARHLSELHHAEAAAASAAAVGSPRIRSRSGSPAPAITVIPEAGGHANVEASKGDVEHDEEEEDDEDGDDESDVSPIIGRMRRDTNVSEARIQFSNVVRIAGGMRTHRSPSSTSWQTRGRRSSTPSGVPQHPSHSRAASFASSTAGPSASASRGSGMQTPGDPHSPTPSVSGQQTYLGSIAMRPNISRPGSFLSSEMSRASTPNSLYAPLLQPSATAPSPGRAWYLTFDDDGTPTDARRKLRDDGTLTYREMVRKQMKEAKRRKRKEKREKQERRRKAQEARLALTQGGEGEVQAGSAGYRAGPDERAESMNGRSAKRRNKKEQAGTWDFCTGLCFPTSRRRKRRSNVGSDSGTGTDGDSESSSGGSDSDSGCDSVDSATLDRLLSETSGNGDDLESGQVRAVSNSTEQGRRHRKGEMEVLFGQAPRRWFRLSYWLHRFGRMCGGRKTDED